MSEITMPVAFHFSISFADETGIAFTCQEVSGLDSDLDVDQIVEGGENRFVYRLPKGGKHSNLKLKRGLAGQNSRLIAWCKAAIESGFDTPIQPQNITVSLSNERGIPLTTWKLSNTYPVKWSVGGFDAMKNEVAVEEIELAFATIERIL